MRIKVAKIILLALICASAGAGVGAGGTAFAEGSDATKAPDPRHQGFYYGLPNYLYGTKSVSGAQLGCQMGALHFRLDAGLVADSKDDQPSIFAIPSIGIFYSKEWESKIRTYEGASIGIQKGIWNSFEGMSYFLNFLTGAEWFVFERKAIYLEIGSGMAYPAKDGAYEGGTVIGGGIKCFF